MATILVTGATGYIGGRLLRHLEDDGHAVRCLARRPEGVRTSTSRSQVVRGDCLEPDSLAPALSRIEVGDAMYEIGGPRVMSCGDVMLEYARLRGLKRYLVPVPLHALLFRGLLRNIGRRAVVWDAASR